MRRLALTLVLALVCARPGWAEIPWGKLNDLENDWGQASIRDSNGLRHILYYHLSSFDAAADGDELNLYEFTDSGEEGGKPAKQAQLAAFRAVVAMNGERRQAEVTLPTTKVKTRISRIKTLKYPERLVFLRHPKESRLSVPESFFPEHNHGLGGIKLDPWPAPKDAIGAAARVARRFHPFESGLYSPALGTAIDAVLKKEIKEGAVFKASDAGETDVVDEFAQKRRKRIIAAAKKFHHRIAALSKDDKKFDHEDGEAVWGLVGAAGLEDDFTKAILAALADGKRAEFVGRFRTLLLAELTGYRDLAVLLLAHKGMLDHETVNAWIDGFKGRVSKTISGDKGQLKENEKAAGSKGGGQVSGGEHSGHGGHVKGKRADPPDHDHGKVDDMFGK